MCWDSDINYVRLVDFAETMEDLRPAGGTESGGPALCQEGAWDGCFAGLESPVAWTGVYISKRRLDPLRSKIVFIQSSTKESSD